MLTIHNLTAGYGKLTVLHDLSLTAEAQRFTAILGPNGSGKSTLLKSVFGLTTIFSGSIQCDGKELVGLPTERMVQQRIAYVPQRRNIFTDLTVRENLLLAVRSLPRAQADAHIEEAYALFPILGKRQRQPAGQLSGGERQMVAIAWLLRPQLILLDEPSAGLAPLIATEVFRTLRTLNEQGITTVVVEQNARRVLEWCEYVFVLREGRVVFEGTADACRADEDMLKNYLGVAGKMDIAG
ncbi:MAG: ABC transporter ATP-binding protein [Anaerolineae bacterium]|nr:ABC transporter ATP-binding protein [Anaerolineae bacterium]